MHTLQYNEKGKEKIIYHYCYSMFLLLCFSTQLVTLVTHDFMVLLSNKLNLVSLIYTFYLSYYNIFGLSEETGAITETQAKKVRTSKLHT